MFSMRFSHGFCVFLVLHPQFHTVLAQLVGLCREALSNCIIRIPVLGPGVSYMVALTYMEGAWSKGGI